MAAFGATARFPVAGWYAQLTQVAPARADMVLAAPAIFVGSGTLVELLPSDLVLAGVAAAPYSGAIVYAGVPPELALAELSLFAGTGTAVVVAPPPDIVLDNISLTVRVGASVQVRGGRTTYRVSTVAGWAVAAGPSARVPRHLRVSSPSIAALAGASLELPVDDLVLTTTIFEIGARARAVRGKFLLYS